MTTAQQLLLALRGCPVGPPVHTAGAALNRRGLLGLAAPFAAGPGHAAPVSRRTPLPVPDRLCLCRCQTLGFCHLPHLLPTPPPPPAPPQLRAAATLAPSSLECKGCCHYNRRHCYSTRTKAGSPCPRPAHVLRPPRGQLEPHPEPLLLHVAMCRPGHRRVAGSGRQRTIPCRRMCLPYRCQLPRCCTPRRQLPPRARNGPFRAQPHAPAHCDTWGPMPHAPACAAAATAGGTSPRAGVQLRGCHGHSSPGRSCLH